MLRRTSLYKLRPAARQIHLWITLLFGLPIAILSAAGLPVTYWNQTDTLFARDFFPQQAIVDDRQTLDVLVSAARAVPGTGRVTSISFTDPKSIAVVSSPLPGMEEREIAVEPSSGRIVGVRDRHNAVVEWLYSLHTRLLLDRAGADRAGRLLVIGLAICSVLLIVSGGVLWWPRHVRWSSISPALRRRQLWRDLHTKAGLYSLPPLILASITAILLSFPETRSTASEVISYGKFTSAARFASEPPTLQNAVDTALKAAPGLPFAVLMNIDEPAKPYTIGIGDDTHGYRWADIDRHSGALLEVRSELSRDAVDPGFLIGLHQGHRFGQIGQLLFGLSSLIPLLLYASGLFIWWQRRNRLQSASKHLRSST